MAFQTLDRCTAYPYPRSEYARRFAWEWVQCLMIRPSPRRAYAWRRFWLRLFGAQMADTASTRPTTRIMHPWLLEMGSWSVASDRVNLYNLGPIRIGEHTTISQDSELCAGTHDHTDPTLPLVRSPVTIGSGVWVCAGAFIGPGVTVGDDSVVAARSVVVKDVPAGVVVGGNPARVIKPRLMKGRESLPRSA